MNLKTEEEANGVGLIFFDHPIINGREYPYHTICEYTNNDAPIKFVRKEE